MSTKVIACTCNHVYQDNRYGNKMRLHNKGGGNGNIKWRCTVCGNEKTSNAGKK